MSGHQEQANQPTPGGDSKADGSIASEKHQDVWAELFGIVHGLAEAVSLSLQAFTPNDDKAVSAITKKRLTVRSIQGLKQGQASIQALLEHLQALQAASQTWQRSMMYASKSHQELMEQIESTTEELHATSERLRVVEAQRLAAVRDAESLRTRWTQQEALVKEVQNALKQREEELETLHFSMHELQAGAAEAQQKLGQLTKAAAEADTRATAATAALDDAKAEASKAHGLAERHQQVVATLTADNLVFLMQLKKAEADLAAANQERAQLRLAAEQQRGPWFDQVRAGVEERVRQALQRAQELEAQMERREAEHASQIGAMQAHRVQLEEQLDGARRSAEQLKQCLESATEAKQRAEELSAAAEATAQEVRQRLDDLAAENRVLQESVRAMRQECTERWVSEQAALGRVGGLEEGVQELERSLAVHASQAAALQRQLETQAGVNRQLMAKKEEVEWQLMAAMAKLDGGAADGPVPLNLHVSGLLQVGGPNQANKGDAAGHTGDQSTKASTLAQTQAQTQGLPGRQASSAGATAAAAGSLYASASALTVTTGNPSAFSPGRTILEHPAAAAPIPVHSRPGNMGSSTLGVPLEGTRSREASAWGASDGLPQRSSAVTAVQAGPSSTEHMTQREQLLPEVTLRLGGAGGTESPVYSGTDARGIAVRQNQAQRSVSQPRPQETTAESADPDGSVFELFGARNVMARGSSEGLLRWTSLEASTIVSSPPSSVALSTEPGSPREVSQVPPATASYDALPTAAGGRIAAVTIRTVSTGPYMRVSGDAAAAVEQDTERGSRPGPSHRRDGADGDDAAGRSQAPLQAPAGLAGAEAIARRGSLHDGGDVWLADAGSSTSSDDSDFLFAGGVMVVRGVHEGKAGAGPTAPPPHQALLYELQQQLQAHLQGSGAAAGSGVVASHQRLHQREAESKQALQRDRNDGGAPTSSASGTHRNERQSEGAAHTSQAVSTSPRAVDDDPDEVIRVRPSQLRASDSSGGARSAITMRTAPLQLSGSRLGHTPVSVSAYAAGTMHDLDDAAGGVFSIVKGCSAPQVAWTGVMGSPVHPVFAAGSVRSDLSPQPSPLRQPAASGSAESSPGDGAGQAAANETANQQGQRGEGADRAVSYTAAPSASASSRGAPIPSHVQAGPPYYATGEALGSSAVATFKQWASSAGTQRGPGAEAPWTTLGAQEQLQQQLHVQRRPQQQPQQQDLLMLPSPSRSSTLRSPRSPPHPAIYVVGDLPTASMPRSDTAGPAQALRSSTECQAQPLHRGASATTNPPAARPLEYGRTMEIRASMSRAPVETGSAAASAPAAASFSRPRVAFYGLSPEDREAVAAGAGGSAGVTSFPSGSVASSTASSMQGGLVGSGLQPHKSGSVKSVRFSDHGPDDGPHRQQRTDAESRPAIATPGTLRSLLHPTSQEARGRLVQRAYASYGGDGDSMHSDSGRPSPGATASHEPYRSRGPVQHPAIIAIPAASGTAQRTTQGPDALNDLEATPSKRLSAAGVAVTAVPRGPAAR